MIFFEKQRRKSAISLVPMIDVLLCLLIFFMLSSQFVRYQSIKLSNNAQNITPSNNAHSEQPITLTLKDNKHIYFEQQRYTLTQLIPLLQKSIKKPQVLPITLTLTDQVNIQALVDVMDGLKKSGFSKLQLESVNV